MGFITISFVALSVMNSMVIMGASKLSRPTCPSIGPAELNNFIQSLVYENITGISLHACVKVCRVSFDCKAFRYRYSGGLCYIYFSDIPTIAAGNWMEALDGDVVFEKSAWNLGPCNVHNCKSDERCLPAGTQYVCKKAIDVCFKQIPEDMCFRRYKGVVMRYSNMGSSYNISSLRECVVFCNKEHPAYKTFRLNKSLPCICYSISVADYEARAGPFIAVSEEDTYEKIN